MDTIAERQKSADARVAFRVALESRVALYMSWMPLIARGGLFVPTKRSFRLGETVQLLLSLPGDPRPIPVSCHVVWVTPESSPRKQGVGVQLPDTDLGRALAGKIQRLLGKALRSSQMTDTL